MYTCELCRFEHERDDVAVRRGESGCICVRCFARETGAARPMPKALRRHLIAVLAELDVAA